MKYARLSDLLRQANIIIQNQLMAFSNSSWKDCLYTVRSTVTYIIFYQVEPIDHGTLVPVPVGQSSAESEHNATCTEGIALAHIIMLIYEQLKKNLDKVPKESPLIVFDIKSIVCMAKNGRYTKHRSRIARRVNVLINGKK